MILQHAWLRANTSCGSAEISAKKRSGSPRNPYEPYPFKLTRLGLYPDIEDAIEGVLTAAGHIKYRDALVKVVTGSISFMMDDATKNDATEYIGTCNKIREEVISCAESWCYEDVGPDELVAWAVTSNHRRWYLEPFPLTPNKYLPLLPGATLGDNRLIVAMGFLLGSQQPYQDWVKLWTQIEFGKGCSAEILRRLEKRTVAGFYISLVYGSPSEQAAAHEKLLKKAIRGAGIITLHPDQREDWEEKAGIADWVIAEGAKKAEGMFGDSANRILRDILRGDFENIGSELKNALIDNLRKASARKRIPQERLDSLEGIIEETGFEPGGMDEVLQRTQVKARIDQHRQEIIDACGPRAPEVMKYLLDDPSLTNTALAEKVGVSERHIYNIRERFKANRNLVRKICYGS